MEVFTPQEVARHTGSKYRGILVAAKFARYLNEFPRDVVASWEHTEGAKKLTTLALQKLTTGDLTFRELRRRRTEA
jgi:DNA-directed RNA polymerase subunit K/omega